MNPVVTQQGALDNSLVAPEKRLKIERCNARIEFSKPQRKETYQVTLDALKLSPCYLAFQITAEVPEIYMHQFWNTIKKIGYSDAYNFKLDKKKCQADTEEDFMYQADNREISLALKEHMPYQTFTKFIINHFISKDKTISMRNMMNLHTIRYDSLLGTLKFVSKIKDCLRYGELIPDGMLNEDIKLSKAYKTYLDYATRKVPPKKARKFKKPASPKLTTVPASPKEPTKKSKRVKRPANKSTTAPTTGVVIRDTPGVFVSKKKALAKADRGKGIKLLSDAALLEDAQLKKALMKSRQETRKLQASGSSKGADLNQSEDESDDVNDEDDNDDESRNDDDGDNDAQDSERTDSDKEKNPNLNLNVDEDEKNKRRRILPKEVSDFATPVIQSTITNSLENVFLAKYSSQRKSTYKAVESLTEFELKKNLLDKMERSESYLAASEHKELYEGLVKSYNLDKDLFSSYGKAYSLKRDCEDKHKDKDPLAGSDQGLKKRKTSKDIKPSKASKSKESKTSSSSKGTKSQSKSYGKSTQAEEQVFEAADSEMQQDQESEFAHTDDQPDDEAASKHDWFKKPAKPSTHDCAWNKAKSIDFRRP
nr:hypothetical protein [Tanacetum cinerariifolium]